MADDQIAIGNIDVGLLVVAIDPFARTVVAVQQIKRRVLQAAVETANDVRHLITPLSFLPAAWEPPEHISRILL
jgi:hypothetical protein